MAAPHPAFGIVGGELLPFTPVSPDTGECFRFEITLVSAEFKTQGSAAAASHPSVAAACSAPDSRDTTAAECSSAAAPSPSCEAAAPQTKKKKPADSSVYALPASSKKSVAFASVVPGVSPERKIAVSLDAAVVDAVEWPEGSCVAVFEQNFKEVKRPCDEAEARKWQREELEMSVFQAKASKHGFIKDPTNKKALGSVTDRRSTLQTSCPQRSLQKNSAVRSGHAYRPSSQPLFPHVSYQSDPRQPPACTCCSRPCCARAQVARANHFVGQESTRQ